MADAADIQSLDALRDLRAALLTFLDDAKLAMEDVEFDIRRTNQWLTHEQPAYWKGEIKRWEQKLVVAKAALAHKKMGRFLDHKPDTSQEEKQVKLCLARIEEAQHKLALCKRLGPELQRAVQEYRGQSMPMFSMIDVEVPKGAARLARMVEALEEYLRLAVPETDVRGAGAETGAGAGMETVAGGQGSMTRPTPAPAPRPDAETEREHPDEDVNAGEGQDDERRGGSE